MKSRHDEMTQQVKAFHQEHPQVWQLFSRFTEELIHRGFEHYSAKGVFERIRWETAEADGALNEFKLNNNYSAFYARAFMRANPEHEGFFRTRHQISAGAPAAKLPPLGPRDFQ